MQGAINTEGYTKNDVETSLATPRASKSANVYGLSVDVFVFKQAEHLDVSEITSQSPCP